MTRCIHAGILRGITDVTLGASHLTITISGLCAMTNFASILKRRYLAALIGVAMQAGYVGAADIEVSSNADAGAGTLREALTNAVSGDRIVFNLLGAQTITLASDLPAAAGDISFLADATPDTIDLNGFASLQLDGALVDPTSLIVSGAGAGIDITTGAGSTLFGDGAVTGDLRVPGTVAPGSDANAGTIGTLTVTGDLDITDAQVQLDISATGGATANDQIIVSGTATLTDATLVPNFIGSEFQAGQQFLVLDGAAVAGTFTNAATQFSLPNNPFLRAVQDGGLPIDDFGFLIEDNGASFTSAVIGCNQNSAAAVLDVLLAGAPPAAVTDLRNGSAAAVALAVNQMSGSIYPSLLGAEFNHIQMNLESVRDRIASRNRSSANEMVVGPWVQGYGVSGLIGQDTCQTMGYHQSLRGAEIGYSIASSNGLSAHVFTHLSDGSVESQGALQVADIDSYRLGGSAEYIGQNGYVLVGGGAGVQFYDVSRDLSFSGASPAVSTFDGSSQFGFAEIGTTFRQGTFFVTPYASLNGSRVQLDSITETGNADFALTNGGGDGHSLRSTLGLSFDQSAITNIGVFSTRIRAGWLHEYLDEFETFSSTVAAGGNLADQGVAFGKDWAVLSAQLDMGTLLGGQVTSAYQGLYNRDVAINSLSAGIQWIY